MGFLNGNKIFSTSVAGVSSHGFVGYGTDTFGYAYFDNFHIQTA